MLLIKYTTISAVLLMILGIFQNVSTPRLLLISFIITGAAYLIGDLFILPKYGNTVTTIADLGLSFLGVWILPYLLISAVEIFFHIYMKNLALYTNDNPRQSSIHHDMHATEFSDEYIEK